MNIISKAYSRCFQAGIRVLSKIIRFSIPKSYERLEDIAKSIKNHKLKKPILVVSNTVSKLDRFKDLLASLDKEEISYFVYTGVGSDPTFKMIDVLTGFYKAHECDSIIAIGGGSIMDAAKVMGVLVKYPKKRIEKFRGVLKVHRNLPFFIAVPTTAGTGSEVTIAAVVTNEATGDKFSISDGHLVPDEIILDDTLLKDLPKTIIAGSGMDALTHAIEAYIGESGTKFTDTNALKAINLIGSNLEEFYNNPLNDSARKNMLYASYHAGLAFTRAYVGYVHSLAHAVGGVYHKSHGLSVAILLPYVLEAYGKNAYKKLAKAYDEINPLGYNLSIEDKAKSLICYIRDLNKSLDIPSSFNGLIKEKDLDALASHAAKEANPWYPVPKELSKKELKEILIKANK